MKLTATQLRKIIREEVQKNLTEAPLKDGGVVNRDSGEILDMDTVPPQYLDHVEVDEMGYTTLPNDKFEELRGELKGLSAGKPKKQRLAPFQLNREKMGEAKGPKVPQTRKPKLGDIYKNKAGHQISVEFLDGGDAGWELLARGKSKSLDGTAEELQAALTAGGFEFDRNENVY